MDNHAGKTYKDGFDMGWLTCAIESEGHITLAWTHRAGRQKGEIQLMPRIGIVNKVKEYIEKAVEVSHSLGVGCYVNSRNKFYVVHWYGMKRVKKLLENIMPYLVTKRKRAELLKKFIDHRLSVVRNSPYTNVEKDLFLRIRKLNGKGRIPINKLFIGNLRDYTSDTKSEDIVQTT